MGRLSQGPLGHAITPERTSRPRVRGTSPGLEQGGQLRDRSKQFLLVIVSGDNDAPNVAQDRVESDEVVLRHRAAILAALDQGSAT